MPPAPPASSKVEITDEMHGVAIAAATKRLRTQGLIGLHDEFSSYSPGLESALREQNRAVIGEAMQKIVRRDPLEPAEEHQLRTKLVNVVGAYNDSIREQTRTPGERVI